MGRHQQRRKASSGASSGDGPKDGSAEEKHGAVWARIRRSIEGDETPASQWQGAELVRVLHDLGLSSDTYVRMLGRRGAELLATTGHDFVDQFVEQMQPRNPVERMLALQTLWQHLRIGRIIEQADRCVNEPELAKAYGAVLENAMNTFRRHVQALDALRSPKPLQFIRGSQVNVGQQQIVSNGHGVTQSNASRVECANEEGLPAPDGQETIQIEPRRPNQPEAIRRADKAVGSRDGATNA